jgi:hypothetical protein
MISRVTDDYERMALCGVRAIVEPAFWLGEARKRAGTFYDYFDHITGFERQRAANYLIEHFATIAVNPRESNNVPLRDEVLSEMPRWLRKPSVVAVGEIGFDDITDAEAESIRRQFEMARAHDLPVLVHTPHVNKLEGTLRTLEILEQVGFPPEKTIIDHNDEKSIRHAREAGCWCGHTVYPVTKLSPERAVNILEEHGLDRMLINSSCDWGPSDPLMVPRTILEMRRRGFSDAEISKVVWENPIEFFAQSGRLGALAEEIDAESRQRGQARQSGEARRSAEGSRARGAVAGGVGGSLDRGGA